MMVYNNLNQKENSYYFYDGKKMKGPYKISKLKKLNICKQTPIWFRGLPEWVGAEYVNGLQDLPEVINPVITKRSKIINVLFIMWKVLQLS